MKLTALTVVPEEYFLKFKEDKKLNNLDLMPLIHIEIKKAVSEFLRERSGMVVGVPVATVTKIGSTNLRLQEVGTDIGSYLPLKSGSTIWQLEIPEDMTASITHAKLLEYNEEFNESPDFMYEDLKLIFKEELTLGGLDIDEDVISFIPFIGYNNCRYVAAVDARWEATLLETPEVRQIKLTSFSNLFT